MRFAPIVLPKTAVRCSWMLRQADLHCNRFARLLAKLDPKWPIKYTRGNLSAYYALLGYLETRFPVFESEFEDPGDEPEWNALYEVEEFGIPVDFHGRDYNARDGDATHAAYAAVEWFASEDRLRDYDHYAAKISYYPALNKISQALRGFEQMHYDTSAINLTRDRTWSGLWVGLPDLVKYCLCSTGLYFLDYSHLDVMEGGGYYPRWSVGEIKALAKEWNKAEPVWKRIKALAEMIDARPEYYVPLMLRVLSGEAEAKQLITKRKQRAGKTLAEVWNV
jgi:hypothetical protein